MLLRQSAESNFKAKFMGPEGVGNSDISAIAGDASEGMLVTLPKDFDEVVFLPNQASNRRSLVLLFGWTKGYDRSFFLLYTTIT